MSITPIKPRVPGETRAQPDSQTNGAVVEQPRCKDLWGRPPGRLPAVRPRYIGAASSPWPMVTITVIRKRPAKPYDGRWTGPYFR